MLRLQARAVHVGRVSVTWRFGFTWRIGADVIHGAIYANLGNFQRAEDYWKRLVAGDPNSESGKLAQRSLNQLAAKLR